MKVSVELNVSDKEFYNVMMKSLQEELNHVSKKIGIKRRVEI